MKYKLIMLLTLLLCVEALNVTIYGKNVEDIETLQQIRLTKRRGDIGTMGNIPHSVPMRPVIIGYSDYVLFLHDRFDNAELEVRQEGNVVFSTYVETGANQVVLPSSLEGECELIMHANHCVYTGWFYIGGECGDF